MSNHDIDIEALLASVLEGNDPIMDAFEKPEPLSAEPVAPEKDEGDIDIDSIMDGPDYPDGTDAEGFEGGDERMGLAEEATKEKTVVAEPDSLHVCKDEAEPVAVTEDSESETTVTDEVEAELPEIDESVWSKEVKDESIKLPEFTTDDMMADLDMRNFGTLVSLNTQRWQAKTRDHKAAADAANATGADARAFEARKRLLVGADEKLRKVHTAIDAARTEHYKMTLPWSTVGVNDFGKRAGPRLLPNTLFFEYTKKMGTFKQEMETMLDEFVQAYPKLIAIAQSKLGGSFKASDYPAPSQIRRYFDLSFDFLPIPSGADFDNVQIQQADKLAAAVNKKTKQMLENAMQDAWSRLLEDVTHAYNSLSNPNAKFHFTLIGKMRDHSSMLKHLNATKDPRIEILRAEIEKGLCRWDVKEIRKDDALRATMAKSAKKILELMQEYTNDSQK